MAEQPAETPTTLIDKWEKTVNVQKDVKEAIPELDVEAEALPKPLPFGA